jgi:hypothetical protein
MDCKIKKSVFELMESKVKMSLENSKNSSEYLSSINSIIETKDMIIRELFKLLKESYKL